MSEQVPAALQVLLVEVIADSLTLVLQLMEEQTVYLVKVQLQKHLASPAASFIVAALVQPTGIRKVPYKVRLINKVHQMGERARVME